MFPGASFTTAERQGTAWKDESVSGEMIASLHIPLQQEQEALSAHRAAGQAHSPLSGRSKVKVALSRAGGWEGWGTGQLSGVNPH